MEELSDITRHLLRFSPDALVVVDGEGCIVYANETVTTLFGHAAATLVGQRLHVLIPERMRAAHEQYHQGFVQNPVAREMGARSADLFGRRADGTEFPAGIRLAPFRIGNQTFVAAAIRDMTERRRVNEALVVAREEADRANRAKSRFLATASHDLRQPLQTIRLLNAAMLKVNRPELKDMLQQQGQAIDSMIRLLNSLLDISRLESGAITPELQPVPLGELLEELRSEFEPLARTRGLRLEVHCGGTVVQTDRILLHQLLQNLVGNALKYTDRGSVAITATRVSDGVDILVDDTGIGIPADKLERVFDEYYQVDNRGTQRMGVGLGLAIVREVAHLLGFTVRIISRAEGGTRAELHIPSSCITTAAPAREANAENEPTLVPVRPRILLVEDNDSVRAATELFLKFEGFDVVSAGSPEEADVLFTSARPSDVLISDYHLDAERTGLDLLASLRNQVGVDVPGIILTGDLPSVLRKSGALLPASRLLPKPVDTQVLIDAITELGSVPIRSAANDPESPQVNA